jgi:hypothetical protein
VESASECGNVPLGSIKCKETMEWLHNWWYLGILNSAWLHIVSLSHLVLVNFQDGLGIMFTNMANCVYARYICLCVGAKIQKRL